MNSWIFVVFLGFLIFFDMHDMAFAKDTFDYHTLVSPEFFKSGLDEMSPERIDYINEVVNRTMTTLNFEPTVATLLIFSNNYWSGSILDSDFDSVTKQGDGDQIFDFECTSDGNYSLAIQKQDFGGYLILYVVQNEKILDVGKTDADYGMVTLAGKCFIPNDVNDKDTGGCLIATATYGTELAPQVQLLREVRDNVLFSTGSGTTFMAEFNEFYYSFSPAVADLERQSPLFRETVKATITPMLSTMSILNYASIDSEQEMLGYGIGVILLNIGMYFVAPAIVIVKLTKIQKIA